MLAAKNAPRSRCQILELGHGLAEIVKRGVVVSVDDLREAVTTLEDARRIARRVLGGAHPLTEAIETSLREARAVLRARETPSGSA